MKKLIIAACGFMMALSTAAFAADAENTDSTTVEHSKTLMGKPKKVTKRKVVKKGEHGEEKATIVDTEIKQKDGKIEHKQEVEGSAKEIK